jgi:hypothetical protein
MALIDIATWYKRQANPRRPFSYFFKSRGFQLAEQYLKEEVGLSDAEIMVREMPSRGHPTVAKVHPIIAVEFLRWLDYGIFYHQAMKQYGYE